MPGRKYEPGTGYRYGFNGKEKEKDIATDDYDFGARIYDGRIGRWLSVDPLQKNYEKFSPYIFVLNSPTQALDPDGKLVIFINGFWGTGTGACCGGNKNYWSYSNNKGGWAEDAKKAIGDYHARYYDGSSGGLWRGQPWISMDPASRKRMGYAKGKKEAAAIIASLQRDPNDPNKITESIKFITNSMGASYQRGFSQALKEYVDNYNSDVRTHNASEQQKLKANPNYKTNLKKELTGFEIEYNVDLAAFQGKNLPADTKAKNNYFMRSKKDKIAGYNGSKVPNATEIGTLPNGDPKSQGHHASYFPAADIPKSQKNGSQNVDINEK